MKIVLSSAKAPLYSERGLLFYYLNFSEFSSIIQNREIFDESVPPAWEVLAMTTYEALSLMITFGILVATIILGCK